MAKKVFKIYDNITIRKEENEYLVYNPKDEKVYILNLVGGRILELCDGKRTIEDIAKKIIEEYADVSYEKCLDDVRKFVEKLAEIGLVEVIIRE